MCCSLTPNVPVRFSDTILYAAEAEDARGKIVHVLGYENTAQNRAFNTAAPKRRSDEPQKTSSFFAALRNFFQPARLLSSNESGGNAMILPFPAVPRTMTAANVLDTEKCPHILKDIAKALDPPLPPSNSFEAQTSFSMQAPPAVQIFEAAGIYTVVLAQDARAIPDALSQVPKEKRPGANPALFEAYARWYPDWTIALCCFSNTTAKRALPLLWWYEPMFPEQLFLPALDCHTGDVPDLSAQVEVDHAVAVGSYQYVSKPNSEPVYFCPRCLAEPVHTEARFCHKCASALKAIDNFGQPRANVFYRDEIPLSLAPYLLNKIVGEKFEYWLPNGDFVCQLEDVRRGKFNPVRKAPAEV